MYWGCSYSFLKYYILLKNQCKTLPAYYKSLKIQRKSKWTSLYNHYQADIIFYPHCNPCICLVYKLFTICDLVHNNLVCVSPVCHIIVQHIIISYCDKGPTKSDIQIKSKIPLIIPWELPIT